MTISAVSAVLSCDQGPAIEHARLREDASAGHAGMAGHEGMNELRELRRDADLSQRKLAELLSVPVNTLRMWDSGLRPVPFKMTSSIPIKHEV